jgi:putative addiction module killer protein
MANRSEAPAVLARINARIRRLSEGNPGDVKPVGEGISEMRIHYGPGYRVYYLQRGHVLIVLLAGGDKSTQDTDIKRALKIAQDWKA